MAINFQPVNTPELPPAIGGGDWRRRLLAAQLMQQQAATDDKVYSNGHGAMKLLAAAIGGGLEGFEERKATSEKSRLLSSVLGGEPAASSSAPVPPVSGGGGSGVTADQKTLYDGLIQRGVEPVVAAAAIGNMGGESGFKTDIWGDKNTSYGLAQWRGPRLEALKALAASKGKDISDQEVQLDHLVAELRGPEAKAYEATKAAKTPEEAALAFAKHFERPASWALEQSGPKRAAMARSAYDQFGGAGVLPPPAEPPMASASIPGTADAMPTGKLASADPNFMPQQLGAAMMGQSLPQTAPMPPERPPETYTPRPPLQPQAQAPMAPGGAPGGMQMAQAAQQQPPQPQAQPRSGGVDPRIMRIMASEYFTPQEKQMLIQQIAPGWEKLNDGTLYEKRTGSFKEAPTQPYTLGENDTRYGKDNRAVAGAGVGAQSRTDMHGNPIPANADAKTIRKVQSESYANETVPPDHKNVAGVRKEVQDLPSYKSIAKSAATYKSMSDAAGRDTRGSDVNLIYGLAKIMDPESVVRESEMTIAQAIATLPQQLKQTIESQINATGRLSEDVRRQIMEEAHSRVSAYKGAYDRDAGFYKGIAERGRMKVEDVIPTFEDIKPFEAKKKEGSEQPKTSLPKTGDVIDGWQFKGGDPSKRENWTRR
jgi:hypothetical protein